IGSRQVVRLRSKRLGAGGPEAGVATAAAEGPAVLRLPQVRVPTLVAVACERQQVEHLRVTHGCQFLRAIASPHFAAQRARRARRLRAPFRIAVCRRSRN
ncbi:MAG: hypothetical protein ACPIOQ_42350, partial [Promethearchaeia archaeon]